MKAPESATGIVVLPPADTLSPEAWFLVSGAVSVMWVPSGTESIVAVSDPAPLPTVIVSPGTKPLLLATVIVLVGAAWTTGALAACGLVRVAVRVMWVPSGTESIVSVSCVPLPASIVIVCPAEKADESATAIVLSPG